MKRRKDNLKKLDEVNYLLFFVKYSIETTKK